MPHSVGTHFRDAGIPTIHPPIHTRARARGHGRLRRVPSGLDAQPPPARIRIRLLATPRARTRPSRFALHSVALSGEHRQGRTLADSGPNSQAMCVRIFAGPPVKCNSQLRHWYRWLPPPLFGSRANTYTKSTSSMLAPARYVFGAVTFTLRPASATAPFTTSSSFGFRAASAAPASRPSRAGGGGIPGPFRAGAHSDHSPDHSREENINGAT